MCQIIGYFSLTYALGTLPASIVGPTDELHPVFSSLIAIPVFHEYLSLHQIIGCAGIRKDAEDPERTDIHSFYVKPERQKEGIGRRIMETLEQDEYFLQTKRTLIHASITAADFYRRLGYDFKDGLAVLDRYQLYTMVKYH